MALTPHNIKNQEFNKSVRGFDKEEVSAFLEKVSDEFEALLDENSGLKAEIEKNKDLIEEYKKIEQNLKDTLLNATESSTKAVESAKKQTSLIVKEAEHKAKQIISVARDEAERVKNSLITLKERRDLMIAKLKAMVDSQKDLYSEYLSESDSQSVPGKPSDEKLKPNTDVDDILEKLL